MLSARRFYSEDQQPRRDVQTLELLLRSLDKVPVGGVAAYGQKDICLHNISGKKKNEVEVGKDVGLFTFRFGGLA